MLLPGQSGAPGCRTSPTLTSTPPGGLRPLPGRYRSGPRRRARHHLPGAGVGGGSLVYHGMTLEHRPNPCSPKCCPSSTYAPMQPHLLPPAWPACCARRTIPDDVLNSKQYLSKPDLHRPHQGRWPDPRPRIPMPINWDYAARRRARRRDEAGLHPPATSPTAVNKRRQAFAGRYLPGRGPKPPGRLEIADAARRPGHCDERAGQVGRVRPTRSTPGGDTVAQKVITAEGRIHGCRGGRHRPRLLMKAQGKGTIPRSARQAWAAQVGTNGDRIYAWVNIPEKHRRPCRVARPCIGVKDWGRPEQGDKPSCTGPSRSRSSHTHHDDHRLRRHFTSGAGLVPVRPPPPTTRWCTYPHEHGDRPSTKRSTTKILQITGSTIGVLIDNDPRTDPTHLPSPRRARRWVRSPTCTAGCRANRGLYGHGRPR